MYMLKYLYYIDVVHQYSEAVYPFHRYALAVEPDEVDLIVEFVYVPLQFAYAFYQ
jgi:hypothetical protein